MKWNSEDTKNIDGFGWGTHTSLGRESRRVMGESFAGSSSAAHASLESVSLPLAVVHVRSVIRGMPGEVLLKSIRAEGFWNPFREP